MRLTIIAQAVRNACWQIGQEWNRTHHGKVKF